MRSEVSVIPFSSSAREGTYLVFLPDGRSLEVTAKLYDLMTQLDGSKDLESIARALSCKWNASVRSAEVRDWVVRFIAHHDLLAPDPAVFPSSPSAPGKSPPGKGVTLVPAGLALPLTRRLRVLFHPAFCLPLLLLSMACHLLVFPGLPAGAPSRLFSAVSPSVHLTGYLLILLSVLFHEFGHLSACTYFDCPHGEIRLGLYLIFPVFYANVSAAWRLRRKERVVVDLAGMYFQLLLTIPASLLFLLTRDSFWCLLLLELDTLILFSLNPFLRFDGYWLCSDLLGVPNLRSRSRLAVKALWSRLTRKSPRTENPLLRIHPLARLALLFYAMGTYIFGGAALFLLCRFLPSRIHALPSELGRLLQTGLTEGSQGDIPGALVRFVQLVFLSLLVVSVGRMLVRGTPAGMKVGRALLRSLRALLRKDPTQG